MRTLAKPALPSPGHRLEKLPAVWYAGRMCGRFYDIHDLDDITSRFRVSRPPPLPLPIRYNIPPTQNAPVIRFDGEDRELLLMRWGLIPRWAKDEKIGARMINARAETVPEKPSFRDAYASRRLIVPVSGFYE